VSGKLREVRVVGRHLPASNRRPIQGVEGDYHVALAAVIAQPEPLLDAADERGHIEIRRGLSSLERSHTFSSPFNVSHGCLLGANRFCLLSLHLACAVILSGAG
jgi:hypothetical protein